MSAYITLSPLMRSVFGSLAVVLCALSVFVSVNAISSHLGRKYVIASCASCFACIIVLQSLSDVETYIITDNTDISFLGNVTEKLPWIIVFLCILLFFACQIFLLFYMQKKERNTLSRNAIKESLDMLPEAVCFCSKNGTPLLVNFQMNRICSDIFGREIMNANKFWEDLKNNSLSEKASVLRTFPTIGIETEDKRIWEFCKNILKIKDKEIYEIVGYDITEQYRLGEKLNETNSHLNFINERLKLFGKEVEKVTRQEEILSAKMKVHDEVGHLLLVLRMYLAKPYDERNRKEILPLLKYVVHAMRYLNDYDDFTFNDINNYAKALNINIVKRGELPDDEKKKEIIILALKECITNTVKHAKGKNEYVYISENEKEIIAEFSNDGILPVGEIKETGGLKNLRKTVEDFGAKMFIEYKNKFLLRIIFTKGE